MPDREMLYPFPPRYVPSYFVIKIEPPVATPEPEKPVIPFSLTDIDETSDAAVQELGSVI